MTENFTLTFRNRTEEVQVECKECSKDGLKYICSINGGDTFRIRKNEETWVAKHDDCPVDAALISVIGETYDTLKTGEQNTKPHA